MPDHVDINATTGEVIVRAMTAAEQRNFERAQQDYAGRIIEPGYEQRVAQALDESAGDITQAALDAPTKSALLGLLSKLRGTVA